jgi:hypothetical protein
VKCKTRILFCYTLLDFISSQPTHLEMGIVHLGMWKGQLALLIVT